jgi:hypothetical protein
MALDHPGLRTNGKKWQNDEEDKPYIIHGSAKVTTHWPSLKHNLFVVAISIRTQIYLFPCSLFNDTFSVTQMKRWKVKDELERIFKEAVVA